jgi:hypothetical protein
MKSVFFSEKKVSENQFSCCIWIVLGFHHLLSGKKILQTILALSFVELKGDLGTFASVPAGSLILWET